MKRLTKQQAAIISAYTGILSRNFSDMHEYVEKVMERSVWTHEMANKEFMAELRVAAKEDFLRLVNLGEEE